LSNHHIKLITQQRGGAAWSKVFHHLTAAQQRRIVTKLIVTRSRYYAKLAGRPPPIILDPETGEPWPGSLGADAIGREFEPSDPNCDALKLAAERVKQQLRQHGFKWGDQPASPKKTA
jgi:hypothetical protein